MNHDDVVVNSLLQCTSDVDKDSLSKLRCHDGKTLLHRAAETGNFNAVQLYSDVINVEVVDNDGNTPLHLACYRGFLKIVRFLIEKHNVNPCFKNYFGCTPLHLSSLGGHLNVTEYLIKQSGVSINEQDTIDYTPLHYACAGGNIEIVLHLLLSGANPFIGNMLSVDLVYPEHFAIKHKHDKVAAMLNQWKKKNQAIKMKSDDSKRKTKKRHQNGLFKKDKKQKLLDTTSNTRQRGSESASARFEQETVISVPHQQMSRHPLFATAQVAEDYSGLYKDADYAYAYDFVNGMQELPSRSDQHLMSLFRRGEPRPIPAQRTPSIDLDEEEYSECPPVLLPTRRIRSKRLYQHPPLLPPPDLQSLEPALPRQQNLLSHPTPFPPLQQHVPSQPNTLPTTTVPLSRSLAPLPTRVKAPPLLRRPLPPLPPTDDEEDIYDDLRDVLAELSQRQLSPGANDHSGCIIPVTTTSTATEEDDDDYIVYFNVSRSEDTGNGVSAPDGIAYTESLYAYSPPGEITTATNAAGEVMHADRNDYIINIQQHFVVPVAIAGVEEEVNMYQSIEGPRRERSNGNSFGDNRFSYVNNLHSTGQLYATPAGTAVILPNSIGQYFEEFSSNPANQLLLDQVLLSTSRQLMDSNESSLVLQRNNLLNDMFEAYQHGGDSLSSQRIVVEYMGEQGIDAGGLTRDAFTMFWSQLFDLYFQGEDAKVPRMSSNVCGDYAVRWKIVGTILSHCVAHTKTLPAKFCRSTLAYMNDRHTMIPDEVLLNDFLLYLVPSKRELVKQALQDFVSLTEEQREELIDLFSQYEHRELPNPLTIKSQIIELATRELLVKPSYMCNLIKSGIPEEYQRSFWQRLHIQNLTLMYNSCIPTAAKVVQCLKTNEEDAYCPEKMIIFCFLHKFVSNLNRELLERFLHYVTGTNLLSTQSITVTFSAASGLARRPIAHTCSNTLELSTDYDAFSEFHFEFITVLSDDRSFEMTAI